MNPNLVPPPPPPTHFPPGSPDGPRIIRNQGPPPMNPMHLADQMGRLDIGNERSRLGGSPNPHDASRQYEGYTFFKAAAAPGKKETWTRAERTKMHLSQNELQKMVQRKSKKTPASKQYNELSKLRRTHVDQLIEQHRKLDPRAEWHCVYVKAEQKPAKGKGAKFGDFETESMDVILMKKSLSSSSISAKEFVDLSSPMKNRGKPVNSGSPFRDDDMRPINDGLEDNIPWRPNGPGQFHPPMNGPQQPPPSQFHHHPQQGPPMGVPPMFQGQGPLCPPMPPGGIHPPGAHGPPQAGMNNAPEFEILNGPRTGPAGPAPRHPGQRPDKMRPQFSPPPKNPFKKPSHPNIKNKHGHMDKPPHIHKETEWSPESSTEDDEFMMFDSDDESSGTENTDYDIHDSIQMGRGSLYQHPSQKQTRHETIYRPHCRHQHSKHTLDKKYLKKRYPSGHVELVTASSKCPGRSHSREILNHGIRRRPKIVHGIADAAFDEEYLHDQPRGGRVRNDIRTRMLDDREAKLEHRENMLHYEKRMLDGRLGESRYMRGMPEPLYYPGPRYLH